MNATKQAVIRRLWELADGAEPRNRLTGICWNVCNKVTSGDAAAVLCVRTVSEICDNLFPFKWLPYGADIWQGELGNERRTLAGFLAAWLEDSE